MIKINLARGIQVNPSQASSDFGGDVELSTESSGADRKGGINFFVLIAGPILLYLYQEYMIMPALVAEQNLVSARISEMEQENASSADVAAEIQDLQKQIEQIKSRRDTILSLSKDRVLLVKVFDAIQTLTPEKVWLDEIVFRGSGVEIAGFAFADNVISGFMSSLDDSIFFEGVNLVRAEERKLEFGTAKFFAIKSRVRGLAND